MRRAFRALVLVALSACLVLAALPAVAQAPGDGPPAPNAAAASTVELEALVQTLEDPPARERLARQLKALIEIQRAGRPEPPANPDGFVVRLLGTLTERLEQIGVAIGSAGAFSQDWSRIETWFIDLTTDPDRRAAWLLALLQVAVAFGAGLIAERLALRLVARPRRVLEGRAPMGLLVRVPLLLARTALDLVPIAFFLAAAHGLLLPLDPGFETRLVAIALINAHALVRTVLALCRMLLAPQAPTLRLFLITDERANYLFVWAQRLTIVAVYGSFVTQTLPPIGLPASVSVLFAKLLGLVFTALVVVLILQNRTNVAAWIRGDPAERSGRASLVRARLADVWHVLAIIYAVGVFAGWTLEIDGGFKFVLRATLATVATFAVAHLLTYGLGRALEQGFAIGDDLKRQFPTLEAQVNRYLPVLHRILRIAINLVAALILLQAWGIAALDWLASDMGRRLIGGIVKIGLLALVALLLGEMFNAFIERYMSRTDARGNRIAMSGRARTLLPLLRRVVTIALSIPVALVVLSEIGIDIGPLLAGAGIVGLAIGFGAQTLVKDVITGLFILLEDQVAVGDVVKAGGRSGVVEAISIRTIRLRDLYGSVHTVPFSEVGTVENMTKDFSFYVLDVPVAYREDPDEVIAVLREIDQGLRDDPDHGPHILEPLEVMGVERFEDSAVVVRARIKTLPIRQWGVGREFNRRMKKAFEARGIEMPFPHRTLYFGVDRQGRAAPAHVALESAAPPADNASAQPQNGSDPSHASSSDLKDSNLAPQARGR